MLGKEDWLPPSVLKAYGRSPRFREAGWLKDMKEFYASLDRPCSNQELWNEFGAQDSLQQINKQFFSNRGVIAPISGKYSLRAYYSFWPSKDFIYDGYMLKTGNKNSGPAILSVKQDFGKDNEGFDHIGDRHYGAAWIEGPDEQYMAMAGDYVECNYLFYIFIDKENQTKGYYRDNINISGDPQGWKEKYDGLEKAKKVLQNGLTSLTRDVLFHEGSSQKKSWTSWSKGYPTDNIVRILNSTQPPRIPPPAGGYRQNVFDGLPSSFAPDSKAGHSPHILGQRPHILGPQPHILGQRPHSLGPPIKPPKPF